jgi:CheY-like chemotaxis protein
VYFCLDFSAMERPEPQAFSLDPAPEKIALRVLLAEDDRISSFTTKRQLEKTGCPVTVAADGRDALDALSREDFDVVLMDVQMPVMDGVEATRAIRNGEAGARNADVPIVALTAYAMSGDRERFMQAGMDGYLAKPVDFDELAEVLSRFKARRS